MPFGCDLVGESFKLDAMEDFTTGEDVDSLAYLTANIKNLVSKSDKDFFSEIQNSPQQNAKVEKLLTKLQNPHPSEIQGIKIQELKETISKMQFGVTSFWEDNWFYFILFVLNCAVLVTAAITIYVHLHNRRKYRQIRNIVTDERNIPLQEIRPNL